MDRLVGECRDGYHYVKCSFWLRLAKTATIVVTEGMPPVAFRPVENILECINLAELLKDPPLQVPAAMDSS